MLRGLLLLLNMTGAPRLVARLMMDRRVPLRLKLVIPLAVVYVLSPIDLIPDLFGILGRVDDVVALILALAIFLGMAPREVVQEHLRAGRARPERGKAGPGDSKDDGSVIDASYRYIDDEEASSR